MERILPRPYRFKELEAIIYLLGNVFPIQIDQNEAIHMETKILVEECRDGEQKETRGTEWGRQRGIPYKPYPR